MKRFAIVVLVLISAWSCSDSGSKTEEKSTPVESLIKAPDFDGNNAYDLIQKQVDFGPRVPNTTAHKQASAWMKEKLESYGAKVYMQEFEDYVYDGTKVELVNIIASYNPEQKKRILLAAHWDTRPFADQDAEDTSAPIDGANDGASGVGVLMELARVIGADSNGPKVGVDIILFDGEDWGDPGGNTPTPPGKDTWWCLGSQYWSKNKHIPNYSAYYGILLDMVGAPQATFYHDNVSKNNAARVLDKVWDRAHALGYDEYFISEPGFQGITDDHVYVNKYARIPMIDVIDFRPPNSFMPTWHTTGDNMEGIDRKTLTAVGEVLLSMIYNE